MSFLSWAIANQYSIFFYAAVILVIILLRRRFEWQGPAIGLFKTKVGVKLMRSLSERHRELFRWLGYVGVGIGFAGMAFIIYVLIDGLWKLIFIPTAPAVLQPVIPGIDIPGATLKVPLITGWLALFVVVMIHEFSHGVVSKSHDIPVQSSGLLVLGPILGAFVEPNEEKLKKASDITQYSVYAAGPFSNILSALFFLALLALIFTPALGALTTPAGIKIAAVTPGSPAAIAGLPEGAIITAVNGQSIANTDEFVREVDYVRPGETVTLSAADGTAYAIVTAPHTDDPRQGYLGVNLANHREPRSSGLPFSVLLAVVKWLNTLILWIIMLSIGIGFANLLPLWGVDGGRMLQILMMRLHGEERGIHYWKNVGRITLVVILVLLLIPIARSAF